MWIKLCVNSSLWFISWANSQLLESILLVGGEFQLLWRQPTFQHFLRVKGYCASQVGAKKITFHLLVLLYSNIQASLPCEVNLHIPVGTEYINKHCFLNIQLLMRWTDVTAWLLLFLLYCLYFWPPSVCWHPCLRPGNSLRQGHHLCAGGVTGAFPYPGEIRGGIQTLECWPCNCPLPTGKPFTLSPSIMLHFNSSYLRQRTD